MIRPEKKQNALCALNRAIVLTRAIAYEESDFSGIADALDVLDYMLRLLADPEEKTDLFRRCLEDIVRKNPRFSSLLEVFDDDSLVWPW